MSDTIFYYSDNTTSSTYNTILNYSSWNRAKTLIRVDIGYNVTEIGSNTFLDASNLTTVNFSNSNFLKIIGSYSFKNCVSLTSIIIPNSVTTIDYEAFRGDINISTIHIGSSLTSVGAYAFYGLEYVTNLTFEEGLISIGSWFLTRENSFYGFPLVTNVTIPNSVTTIGYAAFQNFGITNITIPNNVTSIGVDAFSNCLISDVYIPASVTSIGENAFASCSNINVSASNSVYSSIGGVLFNKNLTALLFFPKNRTGIYTIPNGVINIKRFSFAACQISEVNIPNSVINIEGRAFEGSYLKNINIPANVEGIGYSAFQEAANLTSVTIARSELGLEEQTFAFCGNLISVYFLGHAPLEMGDEIFAGTNPNLKLYRKKNFVTGWSDSFQGVPVVLWSDNTIKSGGTGKLRTQAKLPRKILLQGWNTDSFNTYINSEYTLNFEFNESFNETMPYYINEIQSHKIYIRYYYFSWVIQDLDPDGLSVQFINNSQDKTKLPMTGWQYVEGNPPIGTIIQV